ncbi:hypothetical protein [Otariodibacter oris]|uniref:Uncharacterized protein n=1 Tax=Otariodibacter oris TaxID=1032623 RepID=A0A420XFE0_9PAST|nr:hypothetical protein [Otariodibacter oris]QGM81484.1 hypothetical protein A6A10_08730 [Otariodibacter oris]RKR71089.1 hypothetical protein DES31_1667 [Otariodibacter oris]
MNGTQNPIKDLKQWKNAQNKATTPQTMSTKGNIKAKDKPAKKANKATIWFYPLYQMSYVFQQTKWNIASCKKNYPDCFHFKKRLAKEVAEIDQYLKGGHELLMMFASLEKLPPEEALKLKRFHHAIRYLSKQLNDIADYVEQVEKADDEVLNALCFSKA